MKKIICIMLALSMVFAFAACKGDENTPENATESSTAASTEATASPEYALSGSLEEIVEDIYSNTTKIEFMYGPAMEIDLADPDVANMYLGVSSTDSIERAVFSDAMIGSIAYSLCLVEAKDGTDVEALKNEILNGVNPARWICVAAEKVLVSSCGNTIMIVMNTEEVVDDVYNAFNTVAGGAASEPLTKIGEINE